FARDAGDVRKIIEHQHVTVDVHAVVVESQRNASVLAIIDPHFVAVEEKAIFFTGKVFAPKALFSAYNEMSIVVVAFCPRKRCRRIERDPFPTKSDFTRFEHDPKNHISERSGQPCANTGRYT